eukprot:403368433
MDTMLKSNLQPQQMSKQEDQSHYDPRQWLKSSPKTQFQPLIQDNEGNVQSSSQFQLNDEKILTNQHQAFPRSILKSPSGSTNQLQIKQYSSSSKLRGGQSSMNLPKFENQEIEQLSQIQSINQQFKSNQIAQNQISIQEDQSNQVIPANQKAVSQCQLINFSQNLSEQNITQTQSQFEMQLQNQNISYHEQPDPQVTKNIGQDSPKKKDPQHHKDMINSQISIKDDERFNQYNQTNQQLIQDSQNLSNSFPAKAINNVDEIMLEFGLDVQPINKTQTQNIDENNRSQKYSEQEMKLTDDATHTYDTERQPSNPTTNISEQIRQQMLENSSQNQDGLVSIQNNEKGNEVKAVHKKLDEKYISQGEITNKTYDQSLIGFESYQNTSLRQKESQQNSSPKTHEDLIIQGSNQDQQQENLNSLIQQFIQTNPGLDLRTNSTLKISDNNSSQIIPIKSQQSLIDKSINMLNNKHIEHQQQHLLLQQQQQHSMIMDLQNMQFKQTENYLARIKELTEENDRLKDQVLELKLEIGQSRGVDNQNILGGSSSKPFLSKNQSDQESMKSGWKSSFAFDVPLDQTSNLKRLDIKEQELQNIHKKYMNIKKENQQLKRNNVQFGGAYPQEKLMAQYQRQDERKQNIGMGSANGQQQSIMESQLRLELSNMTQERDRLKSLKDDMIMRHNKEQLSQEKKFRNLQNELDDYKTECHNLRKQLEMASKMLKEMQIQIGPISSSKVNNKLKPIQSERQVNKSYDRGIKSNKVAQSLNFMRFNDLNNQTNHSNTRQDKAQLPQQIDYNSNIHNQNISIKLNQYEIVQTLKLNKQMNRRNLKSTRNQQTLNSLNDQTFLSTRNGGVGAAGLINESVTPSSSSINDLTISNQNMNNSIDNINTQRMNEPSFSTEKSNNGNWFKHNQKQNGNQINRSRLNKSYNKFGGGYLQQLGDNSSLESITKNNDGQIQQHKGESNNAKMSNKSFQTQIQQISQIKQQKITLVILISKTVA